MTSKKLQLSLIIPANNTKRLNKTLAEYGLFFASIKNLSSEIIVVPITSQEKISAVVNEYSTKFPFIKILETPYRVGKGGAVSLGFLKALGEVVGYVDSDGAIPARDLLNLCKFLLETPALDGVTGVRNMKKMSLGRRIIAHLFRFSGKVLFGLGYKDTQCGIKIFRGEKAKEVAKKLSNTNYAFDINMLLICKYLNYAVREIEVNWSERCSSSLELIKGAIVAFKELILLMKLEKFYTVMDKDCKENSKCKNILIFSWRDIKHPQMGGAEVYIHQIAKRLAKEYNVVLFTSRPKNLSSEDEMRGVRVIRKGNFLTVYLYGFFYYIFSLRKYADLIIDVENGIPFFTPLFSRKPKILIVHHIHAKQWFKQFFLPISLVGYLLERFLMPLLYKNVSVVTVSPSSLKDLRRIGFRDKNIYLSYNAVSGFRGKISRKSKRPMLLYLGRLKAYKRIEVALRTLKEIEDKSAVLYIAGSGDYGDNIRLLVEELGLENKVKMLGFVSDRKKWELMQKAWVFLMPSMKEGWGITILEAASCKTPSVGFNVGGVCDSIKHNKTGFLAENEIAFRKLTQRLIVDKTTRVFMGNECTLWARKFSWGRSCEVFTAVIDKELSVRNVLSNKVYPWDISFSAYAF